MLDQPSAMEAALLAAQSEAKRILGHLEARTPMGFMKVRLLEKVGYQMPATRDELEGTLEDITQILVIIESEDPVVVNTADVFWRDGGIFNPRQALKSARALLAD